MRSHQALQFQCGTKLAFPRNTIRRPSSINLSEQDLRFANGICESISQTGGRFFIQKQ